MLRFVIIFGLGVVLCGCAPTAGPASAVEQRATLTKAASQTETELTTLLGLIRRRLEIMPGVAQAKWNRKQPITDPKREAALLEKMVADATPLKLPEADVRQFFQAQMTAAKLVQERLTEDWTEKQQPPFAQVPDLEREVRPKIDGLNQQLLAALANCWAKRSDPEWQPALERVRKTVFSATEFDPKVIDAALEPLGQSEGPVADQN